MQPFRFLSSCVLVLALASPALAQNAKSAVSKPSSVCISLDSNYERIQAFLPSLAKFLQKDVPRQQQQVQVIAAGTEPRNPIEFARAKNCQYLLQLSLVQTTGVSVGAGFTAGTFSRESTPETERDLQQLQALQIKYRLQSLNDRELDVNDSEYVHQLDYPSIWDAAAFETAVDGAASRVAANSLKHLPKN
jgi:hypothetical protein